MRKLLLVNDLLIYVYKTQRCFNLYTIKTNMMRLTLISLFFLSTLAICYSQAKDSIQTQHETFFKNMSANGTGSQAFKTASNPR